MFRRKSSTSTCLELKCKYFVKYEKLDRFVEKLLIVILQQMEKSIPVTSQFESRSGHKKQTQK